nr:pyruvate, phosphate dikinase [Tanacetum cinerariifolium]
MTKDEIYSRIEKLSKVNPMLGFCGCSGFTMLAKEFLRKIRRLCMRKKPKNQEVEAKNEREGGCNNVKISRALEVLQNEATVDLFAPKIQIQKQPLDAADYILIGIKMSVVKIDMYLLPPPPTPFLIHRSKTMKASSSKVNK